MRPSFLKSRADMHGKTVLAYALRYRFQPFSRLSLSASACKDGRANPYR